MEKKVESGFFIEATSIIIGHGVGSGILAVPYLASRVSWQAVLGIVALAYVINLTLHLLIAELSLKQFIKCFESELFTGKLKKLFTSFAFAMLDLSVLMNVSGFIAGSAAVLESWLGLSPRLAMIIYYVASAAVVFFGMKSVGIFEKVAVSAMAMVIAALFTATLTSPISQLPAITKAPGNLLALYSMVSFSLSAVMSVPQVVKGLDGDPRAIRLSIVAGTGANTAMLLAVTFMTLLGAGSSITQKGALVDLSAHLGGWVSVIGYIFSLLALTTSLWASTLNLRDIVSEQTSLRLSWLIASAPCLVLALTGIQSFVGFTRLAGIIQVLAGLGIIAAYNRSRRQALESPICGVFGSLGFQIAVALASLLATIGSVPPVA